MNKRVIVASTDFRLAYKVKLAISNDFDFIHKSPSDQDLNSDIIVTTWKEYFNFEHEKKIILSWKDSESKIKSEIIKGLVENNLDSLCKIGIDPGKAIGISIIFIGRVLNTNVVYDMKSMVSWLNSKLKEIKFNSLKIKIGNGGGEVRNKILDFIVKHFQERAIIEIVDERNTSIRLNKNKSLHEEAAIRIANRVGTILSI